MKPIHGRMIARLVSDCKRLEEENSMLRHALGHIVNRCIEESVDDLFENDENILNLVDFLHRRDPNDELLEFFDVDSVGDAETLELELDIDPDDDIMPMTDRFRDGGSWDGVLDN